MSARQYVENKTQKDAFEMWWNSGRRGVTYAEVSGAFKVSPLTILNWHNKYRWEERSAERLGKISKRLDQVAVSDIAEDRKNYLKIIKKATMLIESRLDEGTVRVTLADLDKLARLGEFLHGEPDARTEEITVDAVDREIRKLEAELARNDAPRE